MLDGGVGGASGWKARVVAPRNRKFLPWCVPSTRIQDKRCCCSPLNCALRLRLTALHCHFAALTCTAFDRLSLPRLFTVLVHRRLGGSKLSQLDQLEEVLVWQDEWEERGDAIFGDDNDDHV